MMMQSLVNEYGAPAVSAAALTHLGYPGQWVTARSEFNVVKRALRSA